MLLTEFLRPHSLSQWNKILHMIARVGGIFPITPHQKSFKISFHHRGGNRESYHRFFGAIFYFELCNH